MLKALCHVIVRLPSTHFFESRRQHSYCKWRFQAVETGLSVHGSANVYSAGHPLAWAVEGVRLTCPGRKILQPQQDSKQLTHFPHKTKIFSRLWASFFLFFLLLPSNYDSLKAWCVWNYSFHQYVNSLSDWMINVALCFPSNLGFMPAWTCQNGFVSSLLLSFYSPGSFEDLQLDICPECGPFFHYLHLNNVGKTREKKKRKRGKCQCVNTSLERQKQYGFVSYPSREWMTSTSHGQKQKSNRCASV